MSRRRKPRLPNYPVRAVIESLSHEGRGVAHIEGKTTFVHGALPGEEISFMYTGKSRKYDEGKVCEIFTASEYRVEPKCQHADMCGGCSLQHMDPEQQIISKQQVLIDNLQRIGKVEPETLLAPLIGPVWAYRHKARLGVKNVHKKGRVLVGFREKQSRYLADIRQCEVLHPSVGLRVEALAQLIQQLDTRDRIAQIEVAVGEAATVLVFRNLDPLTEKDLEILKAYGKETGLHIQLQPAGPDSISALYPEQSDLFYTLPDYDLTMHFSPVDFTQVNPQMNQMMIAQAIDLLALDTDDNMLDLFCGLGNFTLPLATRVKHIHGVEGSESLVEKARENATKNGVTNAEFSAADLTQDVTQQEWMQRTYSKVLVDPPRSGAAEMMPLLASLRPERILYVACHPGTLARDAGVLVNDHGYKLVSAGVMDMFPHTGHVESMALFIRNK